CSSGTLCPTHKHTHMHANTCTQTHTHAYTHTHIQKHTRTHIHTHAHTHTPLIHSFLFLSSDLLFWQESQIRVQYGSGAEELPSPSPLRLCAVIIGSSDPSNRGPTYHSHGRLLHTLDIRRYVAGR